MRFLRVPLALALMSFQGACSTYVEPIEEKPVISIRKGSFGGFVKAELFEGNQLQRSSWAHTDEETTFQIEQLRDGAFIAARDYLLENPVPDNPEDLTLDCDSYTVVEYIAIDGASKGYSSLCSHEPLEDHFRELERIILGFSTKNNEGDLLP